MRLWFRRLRARYARKAAEAAKKTGRKDLRVKKAGEKGIEETEKAVEKVIKNLN